MARRPTEPQMATMRRIEAGYPPNATDQEMAAMQPLLVAKGCFQASVKAEDVVCHRVILNGHPLGRTELFRIYPDGFGKQI